MHELCWQWVDMLGGAPEVVPVIMMMQNSEVVLLSLMRMDLPLFEKIGWELST